MRRLWPLCATQFVFPEASRLRAPWSTCLVAGRTHACSSMLTGTSAARAGLTKALCRSAGDGELPNVLMLLAHLATTQTQLAELPPAVLEVRTCLVAYKAQHGLHST